MSGPYVPTIWSNETAPAIDADNLNKIEQGIFELSLPPDEPIVYVSRGSRADDANDGLTPQRPKATLAAAQAALDALGGGIIKGGQGTFSLTAVDADGYTFVLDDFQHFEGLGEIVTTISVDVDATWGPLVRGHNATITDCMVTNDPTKAVTWLCGVSTPTPPYTSSYSPLQRVFASPQGVGKVTAAFAIGPDFAGHADMDIATTVLTQCDVLPGDGTMAGGVGICESAYRIGNGTSGNVLQTHLLDCAGAFCRWGVWLGGSGLYWSGSGMTGMTEADFYDTHGGGESIYIEKYRGEVGAMLFKRGYVGDRTGGITLVDVSGLAYNPPDNETIISVAGCHLSITRGELLTVDGSGVATDCKIEMSPFGGDPQRFRADAVTTSSLNPYRGLNAVIHGVITAGIYRPDVASAAVPVDALNFVVTGGEAAPPQYLEAKRFDAVVGAPAMTTLATFWRGLSFDAVADAYVVDQFQVPADWSTVDVTLEWVNDGAGSGDVTWFADLWHHAAGDTLGGSAASGGAVATAGVQNQVVSTVIGTGLAVAGGGAVCNLMVIRAPGDPGDTLANNAAMLGVRLTKAS